MAKALEDRGHSLAVTRPFQLRRYEADRLPDPGQCTDCVIVVNDRSDGQPRARLALSNGASWDVFARVDEIKPSSTAVAVQPHYDLAPLVHAAVAEMLPSIQPPQLKVIQAPAQLPSDSGWQHGQKVITDALVEMAEHVNRLLRENADLMARVEYLERHALARVETAA